MVSRGFIGDENAFLEKAKNFKLLRRHYKVTFFLCRMFQSLLMFCQLFFIILNLSFNQ